jgi:hypothetical protein
MNISFTIDEMISFLKKRNIISIKEKKLVEISHPSNFSEYITVDTISVYKNDSLYMPHLFDFEKPYQWLEMVFEENLKKAILNLK